MQLDLETALHIIRKAAAKAAELGIRVSVAVVDSGGHLIAAHRMDGAGFLSPKIAEAKAFSAAAWRRPTIALGQIVERFPQFLTGVSMMADGKVVVTEGGYPLRDEGAVIGGLGVSGGKPDQDKVCCVAGLAAVGLSTG